MLFVFYEILNKSVLIDWFDLSYLQWTAHGQIMDKNFILTMT